MRFLLSADGAWVLIDGYSDGTGLPVRNVQRVGLQHYAKWNIPTEGYCLFAWYTEWPYRSGQSCSPANMRPQ